MNVTCPQCSTVFRVDPAKVPEHGVRARCSVCSGLISVRRPPLAVPPAPHGEHATRPSAVPAVSEAPAATQPPPAPAVVPAPAPAPSTWPEQPRSAPPATAASPASVHEPVPPVASRPEPPVPASEPPAAVSLEPEPPRAATPPAAPPLPSRFSNPFLQQDPATRARRLARALVSDLVVYYPEKRQRGLAEGNLKELFGEEIRKSWEEYTEQVGQDLAATTPYFTEALNEILAEGRAVFG